MSMAPCWRRTGSALAAGASVTPHRRCHRQWPPRFPICVTRRSSPGGWWRARPSGDEPASPLRYGSTCRGIRRPAHQRSARPLASRPSSPAVSPALRLYGVRAAVPIPSVCLCGVDAGPPSGRVNRSRESGPRFTLPFATFTENEDIGFRCPDMHALVQSGSGASRSPTPCGRCRGTKVRRNAGTASGMVTIAAAQWGFWRA